MTAAELARAALREAYESHPALTLTTTPFSGRDRMYTRFWWRDAGSEERGKLAEVPDAELSAVTLALLAELRRLREPKAKGAVA